MTVKSDQQLTAGILEQLAAAAPGPQSIQKLLSALGRPAHEKRRLRRLLRQLVVDGRVVSEGRGRYSLAQEEEEFEGFLDGGNRGWLSLKSGDAGRTLLRIQPADAGGALVGDRVRAVTTRRRSRTVDEGRVVEVIERCGRPIVGVYRQQAKARVLLADDPAVREPILIEGDPLGAVDGQVVAVLIDDPAPHARLRGRVVRVLGEEGAFATEVERLLLERGLERDMPAEVMRAAAEIGAEPRGAHRVDLRQVPFVTIDPPEAKDFDDAIHVQATATGWNLLVAIADVSAYIAAGSVLDAFALSKGCSTYLPGTVFPMLPPRISEDLCSLAPGRDRAAMVVELQVDRQGGVVGGRARRALIRSAARLEYGQVQGVLDGSSGTGPAARFSDAIRDMSSCAEAILRAMTRRGQLTFSLPELQISLDAEGWPQDIHSGEQIFSQRLIEAFMVAANEAVARHMSEAGAPALYRSHPPPAADKIEAFLALAKTLAQPASFGAEPTPRQIADYLLDLHDKPAAAALEQALLRSLMQASYTTDNQGHYGLASPCYLHFTSPIRRYPDLVVHRLLGVCLDRAGADGLILESALGGEVDWRLDRERAGQMAESCSASERRAMTAERQADALYAAAYMSDRIGEEFDGRVVFVAEFGVFVQLAPSGVEGLAHLSRMHGDYYDYNAERLCLVGRRSGQVFQIGQEVRARVESANLAQRQIDLSLID